jgi:hypothetical protein
MSTCAQHLHLLNELCGSLRQMVRALGGRMPRRPSFLASSSDSSLRMASSTCDEWMKWLHNVSKNDPDDEERTRRSRCTAHAYCTHTRTHGRRRRRVIESILEPSPTRCRVAPTQTSPLEWERPPSPRELLPSDENYTPTLVALLGKRIWKRSASSAI